MLTQNKCISSNRTNYLDVIVKPILLILASFIFEYELNTDTHTESQCRILYIIMSNMSQPIWQMAIEQCR